MKLQIRYDLMDKVKEANGGMSLVRTLKKYKNIMLPAFMFYTFLSTFDTLSCNNPKYQIVVKSITSTLLVSLFLTTTDNYITRGRTGKYPKEIAIDGLKQLASDLKTLDLDTDYKLLMESRLDGVEYKRVNIEGKVRIIQAKYILVPVNINYRVREESILQEHIINSDEYFLSTGTKKKEFKPVYSYK